MQNQRGFIGVGILIAILVGLAVLGGGAYYVGLQPSSSQVGATPKSIEEICKLFDTGLPKGETNFLACPGKHSSLGKYDVTFGAQIVRSDGKDYEAFILYGDGAETGVAHWSPAFINEEVDHVYSQPGEYDASLVLVPRASLDSDILNRKKKIQDLSTLILIKKIHITIEQSGNITVQQ